jgi:hypothetical protein
MFVRKPSPGLGKALTLGIAGVVALVAAGSSVNALAGPAAGATCSTKEFFVSPAGNDRADGTKAKPWKTIEHARDHIRERGLNSRQAMRCDVVVNFRAGDYTVNQTVDFDDTDSGNNGNQVVYRSYDGPGKARFLGAKAVTGWQPHEGNIYKAKVDGSKPFYTLFEDGKRATTARTPNRGADDEWAPYLVSTNPQPERWNTPKWLTFNPGDWDPAWEPTWGDLHDARVVVWSGHDWIWFTDTVPIQNMSWDNNMTTLQHATRYPMTSDEGGSRYYIENSIHFLDQPGEYALDTDEGMVYYWPRGGTLDGKTVYAPTVKTIFNLAGSSPDRRVHDVVFDGFALEYTDFVNWYRYGWNQDGDSGEVHKYPQYDRQIELPRNRFGAITVTNGKNIDLRRLHISNTGYTAVFLLCANEGIRVTDSLLEHIGGDGIKVEGGYPGEGDIAHGNTFSNNFIDHFGELVPGDASGVELMNTGDNEVSHSVIQHSARYAVTLETRPEVANADTYAKGNTFKYLRLAHYGKDSNELGAFYAYGLQNQEPNPIINTVDQVTIEDGNPDPSVLNPSSNGVHMDFGGCGFSFSNIEVTNVQGNKFKGSRNCNTLSNNSFDPGFDPSKMQYDAIGVKADFPYPTPPTD